MKVFHFTLVLEMDDDTLFPDADTWVDALLGTIPGLRGMGCVDLIEQPFSSMEEDPAMSTLH